MGFEKTFAIMALALPLSFAASLHETMAGQPGFAHFYNLEYDEALADFSAQATRTPS